MLKPGTMLGHYEILDLIGVGGMGEVYRAHDNKLKRDVALKVLPEHFARDPDRIARFRREAQVLAQLNHPNIATIYNFEELGGASFLVMELVLGETLRERVAKSGPVPVEEALEIAEQISEALEAAHEKPIIHRDLKPANVKVTPEGKVKVLDFGLAKAYAGDAADIDPHDLPTGSLAGTLKGTILGTPAYMSPEQAKGKTADKRTDIWAFGCVLYELLTGQWVFQSRNPSRDPFDKLRAGREGAVVPPDTVQEIIAKVLEAEPDWTALPERTPPSIRTLLRRCLQKDLTHRLRDATDVRIEIEDAQAAASAPAVPAVAAPVPTRAVSRRMTLVGLACLLAGGILAGLAVWSFRPPPKTSQQVSRSVIPLPPNAQLLGAEREILALSPDGTHLVYVASGGGAQQLYLQPIDSLEARPIAGTEGADSPFFSPDGQWIGFFAGGKLKKVSVNGGASLTLSDALNHRGAAWGPNDTIVFAPVPASVLSQVSAAGGQPQELTKLNPGESGHRWPQFLPGGKAILFTTGISGSTSTEGNIAVQRLDTSERKLLVRGGAYGRYVPTGHLVYYRAGTVMAVPFDPVRLEVKGTAAPVLEGILSSTVVPAAGQFSFSSLGSLVYVAGGPRGGAERTPVWVDRKGVAEPLKAPPQAYSHPQLSPDGQQLAVTVAGGKDDIWIYDFPRGTLSRLTFEGDNHGSVWTPDRKRLAYRSQRAGRSSLFGKLADGTGAEEQITKSEHFRGLSSISPDGKLAFYTEGDPVTLGDIWTVPLEGEGKPSVFLKTPFDEAAAKISPDDRWLAYMSNESGRFEIYVRPFPGPGGKWQISTEGGEEPLWARNGRELFYRSGNKVMAVDITAQPSFQAGTPRMLFEGTYATHPSPPETNFDISPDGQRFLMFKVVEQQAASLTQIHVVLNWFEELKRRVPVR